MCTDSCPLVKEVTCAYVVFMHPCVVHTKARRACGGQGVMHMQETKGTSSIRGT